MWFKKKKADKEAEVRMAIDITTHRQVQRDAYEEAKKAAQTLNKLGNDNGFHIYIYKAFGGE